MLLRFKEWEPMDIETLLGDLNIDAITTGKNTAIGWVEVQCPYCSDVNGFHGGINVKKLYYHCWRCGWKPLDKVLAELSGVSIRAIKSLLSGVDVAYNRIAEKVKTAEIMELPPSFESIFLPQYTKHMCYLVKRNYAAANIAKEWDLMAAPHYGEYKFRIIAPIYLDGVMVSFQGRDITGHSGIKYKACPKPQEVVCHQDIVYGIDKIKNRTAIIVEGITDVWRIGPGAIATFGISYTAQQVYFLSQRLAKAYILYDAEEQAQGQASKLGVELSSLGVNVTILELEKGDPGEMSDSEVLEVQAFLK